jgi:D-alanyl-D-alanine carboxypeptidase
VSPTLPPPPPGYEARMPRHPEARRLEEVGPDASGRPAQLAPEAAAAWRVLSRAAAADQRHLLLLSAFRSVERQVEIVRAKLESGFSLEQILRINAYPGFSEHHTGRALDLGTPGTSHFTEAFEQTPEFAWLTVHAADFGFHLSYPRRNPHGVDYEPWHWCWRS